MDEEREVASIRVGDRIRHALGFQLLLREGVNTVSVPEVRKAKVKAAKATGYSPRTLEKVQVVREASEKDPLRRV